MIWVNILSSSLITTVAVWDAVSILTCMISSGELVRDTVNPSLLDSAMLLSMNVMLKSNEDWFDGNVRSVSTGSKSDPVSIDRYVLSISIC